MGWDHAPGIRRVLEQLGLREKSDHELGDALEKLLVLMTTSMAGFIFLFVEGFMASGGELVGLVPLLIVAGVVIDILPELWLYWIEYRPAVGQRRRLLSYHYGLNAVAYVLLLLTFYPVGGLSSFAFYSGFMLTWTAAFLVGEAVIVFLEQ